MGDERHEATFYIFIFFSLNDTSFVVFCFVFRAVCVSDKNDVVSLYECLMVIHGEGEAMVEIIWKEKIQNYPIYVWEFENLHLDVTPNVLHSIHGACNKYQRGKIQFSANMKHREQIIYGVDITSFVELNSEDSDILIVEGNFALPQKEGKVVVYPRLMNFISKNVQVISDEIQVSRLMGFIYSEVNTIKYENMNEINFETGKAYYFFEYKDMECIMMETLELHDGDLLEFPQGHVLL